jgi:hypothetical protein
MEKEQLSLLQNYTEVGAFFSGRVSRLVGVRSSVVTVLTSISRDGMKTAQEIQEEGVGFRQSWF